jgi:gamma-glutamyltranspeptidase/glutathione hydrolase
MAAHARKHGGALTVADLAQHKADWVEPLAQDYRGYTLHEIPPNGQGIAAQMALGILEGFDLAALPVDSADSLHLQIEAVKLAFADVYEHVSDADTMRVRSADLLDKEYLRSRGRLIDMKKAKAPQARRARARRHRVPHDRGRFRHDDFVHPVQLPGPGFGRRRRRDQHAEPRL